MYKLFLLLLFIFFSCSSNDQAEYEKAAEIAGSAEISYLALGDSYTIGEAAAENERWPGQLADSLENRGFDTVRVEIIAKTGWTAEELIQGIAQTDTSRTFDLVSLLIGVNNQYRGVDIDVFKEDFTFLVKQAIRFAENKPENVFVVSIPDWGVTPFASGRDRAKIAEEIDQYNALKKRIAEAFDIRFFEITDISRKALKDASLTASDSLHPSAQMYTLWTQRMMNGIAAMLKDTVDE